MEELCRSKPEIEYPCPWLFKIIGGEREAVAAAIGEVVGEAEHILTYSHASSSGKYHSFNLELLVASETHRDGLYCALAAAAVVRVVI